MKYLKNILNKNFILCPKCQRGKARKILNYIYDCNICGRIDIKEHRDYFYKEHRREYINNYNKEWNIKNKEKIKPENKKWYAKNKEYSRKKCKRNYYKKRDDRLLFAKSYYQEHRKRILKRMKLWYIKRKGLIVQVKEVVK